MSIAVNSCSLSCETGDLAGCQAAILAWAQMGLKFNYVGLWAGCYWQVSFLEGCASAEVEAPGVWICVCGVPSELLGFQ